MDGGSVAAEALRRMASCALPSALGGCARADAEDECDDDERSDDSKRRCETLSDS
jgi:hypothetical protein